MNVILGLNGAGNTGDLRTRSAWSFVENVSSGMIVLS